MILDIPVVLKCPATRIWFVSHLCVTALFLYPQISPGSATAPEGFLRQRAVRQEVPVYPEDAIRERKTGVAVAEIEIEPAGNVSRVTVLEAPSPSIEASVAGALRLWQFQPTSSQGGQVLKLRGKLTFYFVIQGGKGEVFSPGKAPYVGRWPEKPSGKQPN